MIKIYTRCDYFKDSEILYDNDSFFNLNVNIKANDKLANEVLMKIDRAKLLDERLGTVITPYGACSINDLSSGCKTIINCLYLHNNKDKYSNIKAINVTQCGWNALEELFKVMEENGIDINLCLEHTNLTFKCNKRDYLINGKEVVDELP